MAELPGGAGSGHHQEAGRLEIAGQGGVGAAHQDRGAHHRDVQARVCAGRAAGEVLDLQEVAHAGRVRGGPQFGVLGQRNIVVGQRPVDHGGGAQHHPVHTRRRGGGQDGLGAAHVVGGAGGVVGLQVEIDGQVDDDVGTAQFVGDGRVADVQDVPVGLGDVAAPLVDGHDLFDLVGCHQGTGEQLSLIHISCV